MIQCHSKLKSLSVFAFRWYSVQTLKLSLFPEAQSWVLPRVFVPDAGGFCLLLTKAEIFSLEHSHVYKSLYFGFLIWFSYSFDQTTKSLYDLFFRPFSALIFLTLIRVLASMSTSLSNFQHLHKPHPILLLPGFWCLASAYFMNFIFLLVRFLIHSLSWLAHILLACVVSKKLENSAFSSQYFPLFWYCW